MMVVGKAGTVCDGDRNGVEEVKRGTERELGVFLFY